MTTDVAVERDVRNPVISDVPRVQAASLTARTMAWVSDDVFGSTFRMIFLPPASRDLIWDSCFCESPSSLRTTCLRPTESAKSEPPATQFAW
jgi:hypothetical protein